MSSNNESNGGPSSSTQLPDKLATGDKPNRVDRRKAINDNLTRLQSIQNDSSFLDSSQNDSILDSQDSISIMPGQQFFQDLDIDLSNLPRDLFVKELQELCNFDYKRILMYREYLHEKGSATPEYPKMKLISRKNSNKSKKSEKYAIDCYVIFRFIQGERSGAINDVFSKDFEPDDSVLIIPDIDPPKHNAPLLHPDASANLLQLREDVSVIKRNQDQESTKLQNMFDRIEEISRTQTFLRASVNSIRAVMPNSDDNTTKMLENIVSMIMTLNSTVNNICAYLNSVVGVTINVANHDDPCTSTNSVWDNSSTQVCNKDKSCNQGQQHCVSDKDNINTNSTCPVPTTSNCNQNSAPTGPTCSNQPSTNVTHNNRRKTYSEVIIGNDNPSNQKTHNSTDDIVYIAEKLPINPKIPQNDPTKLQCDGQTDKDGFVAVRRKRSFTYHVSNIDSNVTENDIVNFFESKNIPTKQVRIFYHGERSASAKVVIPEEFRKDADNDEFWPVDVIVRKWKSKAEWENEIKQRRDDTIRRQNRSRSYTKHSITTDCRDYQQPTSGQNRRDNYSQHRQIEDIDRLSTASHTSNDRERHSNNHNPWGTRHDDWNDDEEEWYNC